VKLPFFGITFREPLPKGSQQIAEVSSTIRKLSDARSAQLAHIYGPPPDCKGSLRVLRRALRLAVEWGITPSAPKIKLLRGEHHRERIVLPEEEVRYLGAAGELMADIATVLIDTGMRPEENSRLRWESIGWSNGQYGTLQVTHGKTAAATSPPCASARGMLATSTEA
jgi:integrase